MTEPRRPTTVMIGSLPPPATGQSLSFEMLCNAFRALGLPHVVIDASTSDTERKDGSFSFERLASLFGPALSAARHLFARGDCTVYLLIAQSWLGFLRDLVFIGMASVRDQRIVLHLKGGNYDTFYAAQSPWRQRLIRRTLARADHVLVLSERFRAHFEFLPDAEHAVQVVLNGLPIDRSQLPEEPKQLTPDEPIQLLFLSNLFQSKGYLDVLEATRILVKERGQRVRCHFGGDFLIAQDTTLYSDVDEARIDFFHRVEESGLDDVVEWHGRVDGAEKHRLLRESHLFLLPTRYLNEGQPVSIIEALAFGCGVISTDYRSIPEMLDGGDAGLLVPYEDPVAIANAIQGLIEDPEAYAALSRRARAQYENRFSRRSHLERILPLILGDPAVRERIAAIEP